MNKLGRLRLAACVLALLIAGVALSVALSHHVVSPQDTLANWYRGDERNLYVRVAAAIEATQDLQQAALPILLSNLDEPGSSAAHFWAYRKLPQSLQRFLSGPVSGDDIVMQTLHQFLELEKLPDDAVARVAKRVPAYKNPSVRMAAFLAVHDLARNPRNDSLRQLCQQLQTDVHPGVRLRAAVHWALAEATATNSIPLLVQALEDRQLLDAPSSVDTYTFGQPPDTAAHWPVPPMTGPWAEFEQRERALVIAALENVQALLDEHQRALLQQAKALDADRRDVREAGTNTERR